MKFNDALSRVAWQDFEVLVANHFRDRGYDVMHCGDGRFGLREGSDVDLRLRKDGKLALVHCRHESVSRVDADAVARLLTIANEDEAAEVFLISSAEIPDAARQVAEAGGATVIDGVAVRALLGERLGDLHPIRALPGVDPQHGKAHVVTRSNLSRNRTRHGWRLFRGGPTQSRLTIALLVVVMLAALASYLPALKKLGNRAPAAAETTTTETVPLPTPP